MVQTGAECHPLTNIGKPDEGEPHVRIDEGVLEIRRCYYASTPLYKHFQRMNFTRSSSGAPVRLGVYGLADAGKPEKA